MLKNRRNIFILFIGIIILGWIIYFKLFSKTKVFFSNEKAHKHIVIANDSANLDSLRYTNKKYNDTISIDYHKNIKLLNILKLLPESTMRSWEWSKEDRIKTVQSIVNNNYFIDSTEAYNNIKYIKPNTLGTQVIDGFWTLSIYEFNENHSFVVTNDIVGDGNDIQTFVFINNRLTPTKMINWFDKFHSDIRFSNTEKCMEFIEDNQLSFNYDFTNPNIVIISSWLIQEETENCLKGNSIKYKLNKKNKTFDIVDIYWKKHKIE